jgi:hypothetical protein
MQRQACESRKKIAMGGQGDETEERRARLARELKDNLRRRKAQAQARARAERVRGGGADDEPSPREGEGED